MEVSFWPDGRVKEETDARGYITRHDYDWVDLEITVTNAYGTAAARSTVQYLDATGNVWKVEDGLGHATEFTFNNRDWVVTVTDALGHETNFTHDDNGQVLTVTDALNKTTTLTRDQQGRVVKTTDANGNTTQVLYNANGQQVASIDGLGNASQTAYDLLGRISYQVDARGGVTRHEYDAAGHLLSLTDPVGNVTSWLYNGLGQQVTATDPRGNDTLFEYDDNGRPPTEITDRLGRQRLFYYFDNGWLESEVWKNAGGTTVNTKDLTYNANGQVLTIADNNGTITNTFDALGRLDTQQDVHGITRDYTWDAADRVTQITDTKNGQRDYQYDDANRLEWIKFSGTGQTPLRFDVTFNDRNNLTEAKRYSDLSATTLVGSSVYAYDDGGRNTSITHKNGSATTIDSYSYTFDAANRVTAETALLGPDPTFSYDVTNQLTGDGTDSFAWDLNGNPADSGWTVDVGNQLTSDGTWDYVHDDAGNLIQKTNIATDEVWVYAYDTVNHLTLAQHKDSASDPVDLEVAYKFDVLGNRSEQSIDADGAGSGTAVVTKFAYENGNAWADLNAGGDVTMRRLYLDALDSLFARIDGSGDASWYLQDRLGSVRSLVDEDGDLADHIDYDPWGAVANETYPATGDRYKYTGREYDSATGLYHYRARPYDPQARRFLSDDPLGFAAGDANLSRYVGNGPTNATDPSGMTAQSPYDGIGSMRYLVNAPGQRGEWFRRAMPFLEAGRTLDELIADEDFGRIPDEGTPRGRYWFTSADAQQVGLWIADNTIGAGSSAANMNLGLPNVYGAIRYGDASHLIPFSGWGHMVQGANQSYESYRAGGMTHADAVGFTVAHHTPFVSSFWGVAEMIAVTSSRPGEVGNTLTAGDYATRILNVARDALVVFALFRALSPSPARSITHNNSLGTGTTPAPLTGGHGPGPRPAGTPTPAPGTGGHGPGPQPAGIPTPAPGTGGHGPGSFGPAGQMPPGLQEALRPYPTPMNPTWMSRSQWDLLHPNEPYPFPPTPFGPSIFDGLD